MSFPNDEGKVKVSVQIDKEIYEAISEIIESKSQIDPKRLNSIINEALRRYIEECGKKDDSMHIKKSISGKIVRDFIERKVREENAPVKLDLIVNELEREYGVSKMKTLEIINRMLKEGVLYEPKTGYVMPT